MRLKNFDKGLTHQLHLQLVSPKGAQMTPRCWWGNKWPTNQKWIETNPHDLTCTKQDPLENTLTEFWGRLIDQQFPISTEDNKPIPWAKRVLSIHCTNWATKHYSIKNHDASKMNYWLQQYHYPSASYYEDNACILEDINLM